MTYDCQSCGACCVNPDENRREGVHAWVELEPRDRLLRRPSAAHLVAYDADGVPHLRLDGHRCAALRGTVGRRVRCAIHDLRPSACRRVEPGSDRCLQYRAERHVD